MFANESRAPRLTLAEGCGKAHRLIRQPSVQLNSPSGTADTCFYRIAVDAP